MCLRLLVRDGVSEWVSEWVSRWVRERGLRPEHRKSFTYSLQPHLFLIQSLSLFLSLSLCLSQRTHACIPTTSHTYTSIIPMRTNIQTKVYTKMRVPTYSQLPLSETWRPRPSKSGAIEIDLSPRRLQWSLLNSPHHMWNESSVVCRSSSSMTEMFKHFQKLFFQC